MQLAGWRGPIHAAKMCENGGICQNQKQAAFGLYLRNELEAGLQAQPLLRIEIYPYVSFTHLWCFKNAGC